MNGRTSLGIESPGVSRFLVAGLVSGLWVLVSGMLMAAAFGYREMSDVFSRIGLPVPTGAGAFVTHTLVRLGLGFAIVSLFVIARSALPRGRAIFAAAGFAWVLASFFPLLVMTTWGLFTTRLASEASAWSAIEFLLAAWIGSRIVERTRTLSRTAQLETEP